MNLKLDEARSSAERATQAKSEFLATMSHEIRTPMNGVLGMTTVMLGGELPPAVRDGLLTIKQSGDTLLAVLNDILDFSKLDSGKLRLEQVPCNVRQAIYATLALMHDSAQLRGNTLTASVDDAVPLWLLGDPVRLRQVLTNLVSNAIKFTQRGRVEICARTDGEKLLIAVHDSGVGMSPATCAGLFQPFTQADASISRRFGGTGLGLAIVYRIVSTMGGQISASSREGEGSSFQVALPLRPTAPPPLPVVPVVSGPSRRLTVLLAEDNPVNQMVATGMLEQLGHRVLHAEDGAQALELIALQPVDLVLMDCQMPVLDGFAATQKLRSGPFRTIPVVALTAASLPEVTSRCLAAGMDEVLVKPLARADLERVLARFA
jgi:CheY-like chemotaxis protein